MAGHSKWANIKFRKAGQDKKRGKIFTKCIREITAAVKMSGSDPNANPRLRTAMDKALSNNMPRDTIDRAIKRAAGGEDGQILEEIRYEGYGPGGTAIMVDCLSDNRNRTVSEVRHAFTKHGGNLGTDGSVGYLFTKMGQILLAAGSDENQVMEIAIEAGAADVVVQEDGCIEVQADAESFLAVKKALESAQLSIQIAEITMQAMTQINLGPEDSEETIKLIDKLEDLDDVQNVYSNASFDDTVLEKI